jgi:putative ABC transport system ATP-binding protein
MTVVTGRSGSGKSTLMNMLCGFSQPTRGRVLLENDDIYLLSDAALSKLRNEKFGVIPQGQTALHSLTVIENILLPFCLYHESPDIQFAEELLEKLGIASLRNVKPAELSGGELRRMAIARAVIRKPPFIFADEPTGDLDDDNTQAVFRFLREAADGGTAVAVVTHEHGIEQYADRLFRMDAGVLHKI